MTSQVSQTIINISEKSAASTSRHNLSLVSIRYAVTALPTVPDGRNATDEGWWISSPQVMAHRTATFCNVIGTASDEYKLQPVGHRENSSQADKKFDHV